MNRHLERLKRGAIALAELCTVCLAGGAAIGSMAGGFVTLYRAMGNPVFAWGMLVLAVLAFLVYALGVADQRDEKKTTTEQKDKP